MIRYYSHCGTLINFISLPHFVLAEFIQKWIEDHNKKQEFYQVKYNGFGIEIAFNDISKIEIII